MNNRSSGRSLRLASAAAIGLSTCGFAWQALADGQPHPQFAIHSPQSQPSPFVFASDGVLGTSMDLFLHANTAAEADDCHQQIQNEIERLRKILSTYDPQSEISQYIAGDLSARPLQRLGLSDDLKNVLNAYTLWQSRTQNAIHINMAAVIALWKSTPNPARTDLENAFATPNSLNIDALGKGYIIDRAVELAQKLVPAGLLNIGGDIRGWGPDAWRIGIADPNNPAEIAPPLATFDLKNAAVATSASYARNLGRRLSHLINPRTLTPVDARAAATVIAGDCLTANALSTAACVIDAPDAVGLADEYGTAYLITSANGSTCENLAPVAGGLVADHQPPAAPLAAAATAWPENFEVAINVTLKVARGGKVKRPYVAIWVEDAKGKAVRSITIWGTQPKYFRELSEWWQATRGDQKLLRAITRATRDPGKYTVTWDGKDDAGNPLPRGDYTIKMEINREHGRHVGELVKLACQDKKVTGTLKGTAESEESAVVYGAKEK